MHIEHSVAFVTGANRGIGRAFVDALLERGATRIYAAARDQANIDSLARLDDRVRAVVLDVRNAADAAGAASQVRDVTLLINNAGTLSIGSPAIVPIAAVRDDMETNFFGTLNVINAFVPVLETDIFPDPMARQVYSAWRQDHKAVERQFAAM